MGNLLFALKLVAVCFAYIIGLMFLVYILNIEFLSGPLGFILVSIVSFALTLITCKNSSPKENTQITITYGDGSQLKGSSPSTFDSDAEEFILVGIKHDNREKYIREHSKEIDEQAKLSRKHAIEHDPYAVSIDHNGFCCGFISKAYNKDIAELIDTYGDKVKANVHCWVGDHKVRVYVHLYSDDQAVDNAIGMTVTQFIRC